MIDSFVAYIEHLELLTFFSGYPIIYALVKAFWGKGQNSSPLIESLYRSLAMAYALVGTFFILLWFREIYIQQVIKNTEPGLNLSALRIWGFLSIIFWFPLFRKKPVYSLIHSFVFFFLFCKDLITGLGSEIGKDVITNDMKVYTVSIILHLISLILVSLVYFIVNKNRHH